MSTNNPHPEHLESAQRLAALLLQHRDFFLGVLSASEALGPEGKRIVEEVLDDNEIAAIRLSWALWRAVAQADGVDADALLEQLLPPRLVDLGRKALRVPRLQ